jgi:hypothetical protein
MCPCRRPLASLEASPRGTFRRRMPGAQRTDVAQLLVVDDEAFFSAFLKVKFEKLGYSVATAAEAFEALEFVSTGQRHWWSCWI